MLHDTNVVGVNRGQLLVDHDSFEKLLRCLDFKLCYVECISVSKKGEQGHSHMKSQKKGQNILDLQF